MTEELSVKKVALSTGLLFPVGYIIGVIALLSGLMKYWLQLHFVSIEYTIQSFSLWSLLVGILVAFVFGAVAGGLLATLYNWVEKW